MKLKLPLLLAATCNGMFMFNCFVCVCVNKNVGQYFLFVF